MPNTPTSNIYYVYGLYRPDNSIFYIGKGKGNRINNHVVIARSGRHINKHLQSTILKIEKMGLSISCRKLFTKMSECDALVKEIELIKLYGRRDIKTGVLVNLTEGGEGTSGHVVSESARDKLRAARALQISPMFSRRHTEESKAKMSESRKGMAAWNKGIKAEEAELKKLKDMHDVWRGSKQTPDALAKIKAASLNMWQSPEHREKMAIANAAAWVRRKEKQSCLLISPL